MTQMYGEMQEGFKEVNKRIAGAESKIASAESKIDRLEKAVVKTNMTIEHDILPKIDALFDGYMQHSEQLARIENEVSKHEEIIMRRIR
ncbi:MAG: hypothetical protein GX352_07345 [Clostridiales bacterium]|nr:hypothetical protein [Clostridiales bacterium]